MHYLKLLTVEPSFFIFVVVYEMVFDLNTNLFLQKSCRFDRTHEPDLRTKCDDEKLGILFVSDIFLKLGWIHMLLGAILALFVLPWSDKAGRRRRPLIFIAISGIILHSLSGTLHAYFWNWAPVWAAVSSAALAGIAGGPMVILPACQVYICDICRVDDRTVRLGCLGAVCFVGQILGRGGSGFILRRFGFFYSYLLCLTLSLICLIFGLILIKDTSVVVDKKLPMYRMFTNIGQDLVDNIKVIFRKQSASKRIIVSLLLICNSALMFSIGGEFSVLYQYLRYRFGFNEQTYSGYMFYRFSSASVGLVFCSIVLSKYFKMHDGLIGILAGIFDSLAVLLLFFATQIWQIYLIPLLDVFHGTVATLTVSLMSKYYHPNEFGRLNAIIGLFRLSMVLSSSAYNGIFRSTLDTFPTAFCLLSVTLDVVILLCFCGAYIFSKRIDECTVQPKNPDPKVLGDDEVPEGLL